MSSESTEQQSRCCEETLESCPTIVTACNIQTWIVMARSCSGVHCLRESSSGLTAGRAVRLLLDSLSGRGWQRGARLLWRLRWGPRASLLLPDLLSERQIFPKAVRTMVLLSAATQTKQHITLNVHCHSSLALRH